MLILATAEPKLMRKTNLAVSEARSSRRLVPDRPEACGKAKIASASFQSIPPSPPRDRGVDESGRALRSDVREAAYRKIGLASIPLPGPNTMRAPFGTMLPRWSCAHSVAVCDGMRQNAKQ